MANMFYYPGEHYNNVICNGIPLFTCLYAPVFIVLYYVTICLYITGSLATVLVVIVKTLVVVVW